MNKYFLKCFCAEPYDGFQSTNDEDILCPLDQDLMDSLCPVNIETGLREDPLVRVNDPNISDSECHMLHIERRIQTEFGRKGEQG